LEDGGRCWPSRWRCWPSRRARWHSSCELECCGMDQNDGVCAQGCQRAFPSLLHHVGTRRPLATLARANMSRHFAALHLLVPELTSTLFRFVAAILLQLCHSTPAATFHSPGRSFAHRAATIGLGDGCMASVSVLVHLGVAHGSLSAIATSAMSRSSYVVRQSACHPIALAESRIAEGVA
jgi:hypothetical protein